MRRPSSRRATGCSWRRTTATTTRSSSAPAPSSGPAAPPRRARMRTTPRGCRAPTTRSTSADPPTATLYAATGAINTSDAREKSPLAPLSAAEIAASVALGRRIGTFRFLEAVRRKGAAARLHVGLTVQEAIGVLEAHGLDPFAFGFICHDVLDPDPEASAGTGAGAGDRYGFRSDELLLFLARGFEARLTALEAA
ncbi:tail fiber domain-containing protein [Methylobacterium sp. Leaf399]|uniref:tail fiber domain-containing protein n=1 Tax=Methylobacterium sp. Leaf399 TaxID=1736364 RepID=UPI003FCE9ED6